MTSAQEYGSDTKSYKDLDNENDNYMRKKVEITKIPEFISRNNKNPTRKEELEEIASLKNFLNNFDRKKINKDDFQL